MLKHAQNGITNRENIAARQNRAVAESDDPIAVVDVGKQDHDVIAMVKQATFGEA